MVWSCKPLYFVYDIGLSDWTWFWIIWNNYRTSLGYLNSMGISQVDMGGFRWPCWNAWNASCSFWVLNFSWSRRGSVPKHFNFSGSRCEARNPDVFPQLEHRDPNLMLPALEIIKATVHQWCRAVRQIQNDPGPLGFFKALLALCSLHGRVGEVRQAEARHFFNPVLRRFKGRTDVSSSEIGTLCSKYIGFGRFCKVLDLKHVDLVINLTCLNLKPPVPRGIDDNTHLAYLVKASNVKGWEAAAPLSGNAQII